MGQECGAAAAALQEVSAPAPSGVTKEQRDLWPGTEVAELGAQAPQESLVTGFPVSSAAAGEGFCQQGFRKYLS